MSTAQYFNYDAFDTLMGAAELIDFPILQRASESQETKISQKLVIYITKVYIITSPTTVCAQRAVLQSN